MDIFSRKGLFKCEFGHLDFVKDVELMSLDIFRLISTKTFNFSSHYHNFKIDNITPCPSPLLAPV